MPDTNTHDITQLLADALRLPAAQRKQFAEQSCAGNDGLRRELMELLVLHDRAGDFLQRAAVPTGALGRAADARDAQTIASGPAEDVGTRIGPYKLLQLIGEGGFGRVYMAEQEQPVRRRVALKIIKLGMDTRQVIARFEAERQALAMMDHPNIARVFDAGATETGRPYFVMELVNGVPITEYCDKARLNTRQRLELFSRVCHAVQHAHQKGVIHRDIKPTNVLVTLHDGVAVPKIIDFGIAKAVNARLTERTLFTEFRQMIGTPEYMSPEQAEMSGLDIDTRSDIYSLGVLLYELLTSVTPFDTRQLRSAAIGEMQRIIREQEPQKPSTRVSQLSDTIGTIAASRGVEPARLTRSLKGDLDWIVMKAMEKDRTRRYETANGLALDVQRYLNDEPVLAGPPSLMYRTRKFVRRNRGAVVAAVGVAAVLVLGVMGTTVGLIHAQRQRDAALEAQREQSRLREQAERLAEFMEQVLAGAGPSVAAGRDTEMLRDMMDAAARRIVAGELKAVPSAELRLRLMIGDVYRQIAAFNQAEGMLRPALDMLQATPNADHTLAAHIIRALGQVMADQNRFEQAEPLLREALELFRRAHGSDHVQTAEVMMAYAVLLHDLHQLDESIDLTRDALAMFERLGEVNSTATASGWQNLAAIHRERGELAAAEPLYRKAEQILRAVHVSDHPSIADNLHSLGMLHYDMRNFDQAQHDFTAALAMNRRLYPGDHQMIAFCLDALAGVERARGDLQAALPYLEQAMEMRKRLMGEDNPHVATSLVNFAIVCYELGDGARAAPLLRQAADIRRRLLPPDHPDTLNALTSLSIVLQALGDIEGAIAARQETLDIQRRLTPGNSVATARIMAQQIAALQSAGRLDEAESVARECLAMRQAMTVADGQPTWHPANTMSILAGVLVEQATSELLPLEQRIAKLREAEPLAVDGFKALDADPTSRTGTVPGGPDRVRDACRRIIRLYELWEMLEPGHGHAAKAEPWRESFNTEPARDPA